VVDPVNPVKVIPAAQLPVPNKGTLVERVTVIVALWHGLEFDWPIPFVKNKNGLIESGRISFWDST